MRFNPSPKLPLVEHVAEGMRRLILEGRTEGGLLPSTGALAREWEVSRPVILAATRLLAMEGLVVTRQGARTRVLATHPTSASNRKVTVVLISPREQTRWSERVQRLRGLVLNEGWAWDEVIGGGRCLSFFSKQAEPPGGLPRRLLVLVGCGKSEQLLAAQHGQPAVILGSPAHGIALPSVDVHYEALGRHAGAMLQRLGHERVLLTSPSRRLAGDEATLRGFEATFRGGIRILSADARDTAALCRSMARVLTIKKRPTAWMAFRTEDAATMFTYLLGKGFHFPDDMSLLLRDREAGWSAWVPEPSGYELKRDTLARMVMRELRSLSRGARSAKKAVRLVPDWVTGQTVGAAPAD